MDGLPEMPGTDEGKGMTKAHDLSEYFITQMADVMQKNGLKFSGWQEVALGHTEEAHQQLRARLPVCIAGILYRALMKWFIRQPITVTRSSLQRGQFLYGYGLQWSSGRAWTRLGRLCG